MTWSRHRRWFAVVPFAAVTTSAIVLLTGASTSPPKDCEVAEAWVAAHKSSLPTNLAEFNKLSPVLRRHAYAHLSPEARLRIWTEKMMPLQAPNAGLNADQRAFIVGFIHNLPQLVDSRQTVQRTALGTALANEAKHLFSDAQIRELFYTLGSAQAPAALASDCECNADFPDFNECAGYPNDECVWGGAECTPVIMGCGFTGMDSCDGVCL